MDLEFKTASLWFCVRPVPHAAWWCWAGNWSTSLNLRWCRLGPDSSISFPWRSLESWLSCSLSLISVACHSRSLSICNVNPNLNKILLCLKHAAKVPCPLPLATPAFFLTFCQALEHTYFFPRFTLNFFFFFCWEVACLGALSLRVSCCLSEDEACWMGLLRWALCYKSPLSSSIHTPVRAWNARSQDSQILILRFLHMLLRPSDSTIY